MSLHIIAGTYGPFTDTGPGTILVDPLARIISTDPIAAALALNSGPWDVTIKGLVVGVTKAIDLTDAGAFVSTIKLTSSAVVAGGSFGIEANHATNISNAGRISEKTNTYGIWESGTGDFTIKNLATGLIEGGGAAILIDEGGTHKISNAGTIASFSGSAAIMGEDGSEIVTNFGKILGPPTSLDLGDFLVPLGGGIDLGDGADSFTNFKKIKGVMHHGTIAGLIDLGAGDDTLNGGKHTEIVRDGQGTDTYNFGGGNDFFIAGYTSTSPSGDGADIVNGGGGFDIYFAGGLASNCFLKVNLDTVDHFGIAAHTATLFANGPSLGTDTITGFEEVLGTDGFDLMVGSKGAEILAGGAGNDTIFGLGGADFLNGGDGIDSFIYTSLKDSGPTKATRDFITDFTPGDDRIDLQSLDTNNNFHFVGNTGSFDGSAGAIIATQGSGETIVKLDFNGDKVADFSIKLDDQLNLSALDFQL
jgi:Ca2+-binding RTX toxin-like protein